jgi:hypothetical protein
MATRRLAPPWCSHGWAAGGDRAGLDGLVAQFQNECPDDKLVNGTVAGITSDATSLDAFVVDLEKLKNAGATPLVLRDVAPGSAVMP